MQLTMYLGLMNYLAHAYLSFHDKEILVGNLISDFVKGKKKLLYPENIQKGIILHRAIDTFTDSHDATKLAKEIFRPHYRLYSGAFMDIVYDHFLASDTNELTEQALVNFSGEVYNTLDEYIRYLPERFGRLLPHMKLHNWLFSYRTLQGIAASFSNLVRRSAYLTESETAFLLFQEHYKPLQAYYHAFFPDVKSFARRMYEDIVKL